MFDCFFEQYKDEIYVKNRNEIKTNEKKVKMIGVFIVLAMSFAVSMALNGLNMNNTIFSLVIIIYDIYIIRYLNKKDNDIIYEKRLDDKNEKIIEIIRLLKIDKYNFYNIKGVKYLEEFCTDEINKNKKSKKSNLGIIVYIIIILATFVMLGQLIQVILEYIKINL